MAVNTMLLYFRMLLLSVISFFTVRVVLQALGGIDYGISNVVGSAVATIQFVTATLTSATQRYFSYYLGKGDPAGYSRVYSMITYCYLAIVVLLVMTAEAVAHPLVFDWLRIPPGRLDAAYWYFQFATGSVVFQIMAIPFTASMVAHEKMNGFAYISVLDGVLKLAIAYMIYAAPYDKLKLYGFLLMISSMAITVMYWGYCRRNFAACRFQRYWDKAVFREIGAYTGWNLFGSASGMLMTQGQNILLNLFFGPLVNTAKGIADRIASIVQSFSTNFFMAISPQIVKSYVGDDRQRTYMLVVTSTRISYFLILAISFPLIVCFPEILALWLGKSQVTPDMVVFCRLTLCYCLVISLEQPITQMVRASGHIRNYQVKVGVWTLMFIPLAAVVFWLGAPAYASMYVLIGLMVYVMAVRLAVVRRQFGFDVGFYMRRAAVPILAVSSVLGACGYALDLIPRQGAAMLVVRGGTAVAVEAALIWWVGLNAAERNRALSFVAAKLKRHPRR